MITPSIARAACFLAILGTAEIAHAESDAKNIVAIGGSVTEIVYALGEEDRLIARDTTSVFPAEATKLPDVGYIRALSPEGVLSINPDMILALEGSGPPEAFEVLKKASVPVVTIPESYDRAGIVAKIRAVGGALGVDGKAAALAARVEDDVRTAQKLAAKKADAKRVLFVLSLNGGRVMAAGARTGAAAIIEMAGGENAVSNIDGYKQITDEAVIAAAPDIILMMTRTGNHPLDEETVFAHPALAATPAAENRAIVQMGGQYLLGFGPRTAEAIRDLSIAFNGDTQ
ncbi:hemin ABC transporter substrate-binding protein [Hoeflea sp. TYP-13]|uniref:hemin ABC transporter substrate-binding protein n=1 Tax=Hoeflea sp. TYP-13 TaxID=3230023 RepID=UPI0034C68609